MKTTAIILIFILVSAISFSAHAEQTKNGPVSLISAEELKAKIAARESVTVLDVRNSSSFSESSEKIPGALHIKLRRLRSRLKFPPLKDLPKDREVITYCACPNEETSMRAAQVLAEAGFTRVRALRSGWQGWLAVGGPVEQRKR